MQTVQQLRDRIAELGEEVRQLREDMAQTDATFLHFLSKNQVKLLMGIYSRPIADYAYLDRITEQGDRYNRYTDINHEALRNRVSIWKLRQKMREYGIEIKTWRGIGYYLDDENKVKLRDLLNTSAERVKKTGNLNMSDDDLVKRLRKNVMCGDAVIEEAADCIEKLESVTKDDAKWLAAYHKWCEMNGCAPSSSDLITARKALEGKDV